MNRTALAVGSLWLYALVALASPASAQEEEEASRKVRVHLRLGAGPGWGSTTAHGKLSYTSPTLSAAGEYSMEYRGFGSNVEAGAGISYAPLRAGLMIRVDRTPFRRLGPGATGIDAEPSGDPTERETLSLFIEWRAKTLPLIVGGNIGRTVVHARCCYLYDSDISVQELSDSSSGPAIGLWGGTEWRWSEHWAGQAVLRTSLMTSDLKIFDVPERTTVSFASGLMLGIVLN